MATGAKLRQLRWRCRRGMRELDLLLAGHLERHGAAMDAGEVDAFERLLAASDVDLYGWFTGRAAPPDVTTATLVARVLHDRAAQPEGRPP